MNGADMLRQIQADLLNDAASLSTILRKAKVLASQLQSEELANWTSNELDGYKKADEVPDYRIIKTGCVGQWTNGAWIVKNRGVPLFKIDNDKLTEQLTTFYVFDGIRTVEQQAKRDEAHFILDPTTTAYVNTFVGERGYGYTELEYAIGPHDFEQVLDTVRNRLLEFVLKLGENWHIETEKPPREALNNLVSVAIYNTAQGGNVATFDQRGQHVNYQYNAAGNINFSAVHDKDELARELDKLRAEIARAKEADAVDADKAIEAEYHIVQATREARKDNPDKKSVLDNLGKARDVVKDVAALANLAMALAKAAELAGNFM